MPKKSVAKALDEMPEAFVSDATITRAVSHRVKAGKLRKLASRLYTRNLTDPPEAVVKRNLWHIVAAYFPGALIVDRTALENAPARRWLHLCGVRSGTKYPAAGTHPAPASWPGPVAI